MASSSRVVVCPPYNSVLIGSLQSQSFCCTLLSYAAISSIRCCDFGNVCSSLGIEESTCFLSVVGRLKDEGCGLGRRFISELTLSLSELIVELRH